MEGSNECLSLRTDFSPRTSPKQEAKREGAPTKHIQTMGTLIVNGIGLISKQISGGFG